METTHVTMKSILTVIFSFLFIVSGFSQTRNVIVGTNDVIVQPTNFWSANASNARAGLGLGTAATNSSAAFQPSSASLTNLASNDGGFITNLKATNIVGIIPASNISTVNFTSVGGTLTISSGGTGATNAANARANLGSTVVGDAVFIATNASAARTVLGATSIGSDLFTALNASAARTSLELGSAATNSSTNFQQSSSHLTILASSNGANLTNIILTNVNGLQAALDGRLATNGNASQITNITAANINGTVALASNVSGVVAVVNGGTGGTNAAGARSSLGLGSSATNQSSAFQPSSLVLSNIASSNAVNLTNIRSTNIVGIVPSNNISMTSVIDVLNIVNGGTGGTNAATARTNLGLGWSALTNTNAATSLIGFTTNGTVVANTGTNMLTFSNNAKFNEITSTKYLMSLSENATSGGVYLQRINASDLQTDYDGLGIYDNEGSELMTLEKAAISFYQPVTFQNNIIAATRANLGFSTNLNTFWTATNASNARSEIGLGETNSPTFNTVTAGTNGIVVGNAAARFSQSASGGGAAIGWQGVGQRITFIGGIGMTLEDAGLGIAFGASNTNGAAISRTNLGLGWSALTNTNTSGFNASLYGSNTNPVLVNSNGNVVSPTNFWEVAPIQTLVQDFTGIATSQTNNATNARNVYIYSFNTNVSGISNTIILPTNTSTFNGDKVTVIHKGATNTTTIVRQAGSTNNLITINRFDESVKFIRELGQWDFYHNISFVEPIQFSGTNTSVNAAASRTNLGLGATWLTNTNVTNFRTAIGIGSVIAYQTGDSSDSSVGATIDLASALWDAVNDVAALKINDNEVTFANNTIVTNFRTAIELGATNNVTFSNVTASGTLTATSTVTAKTNLIVEGHLDFTTNATNSNPATNNQIQDFIEIRVGTNQFWLPVYK